MPPTRCLACLLAVAGAAAPARAQESVAYFWSFLEVIAGTNTPAPAPNGLIEPGEGVRFSLTVTVSPAIGSTAAYTPPPPPGSGTIAGLGSIFFDLLGPANATGTWSFLECSPGWALGFSGTPNAPGTGVLNILAGQMLTPPMIANPQNPVPGIWRGVWSPSSYAPRTVLFRSSVAGQFFGSYILIQYGIDPITGGPLYVGKYVNNVHGQVAIPIVPAPGAAPILLTLVAAGARRRPVRPP